MAAIIDRTMGVVRRDKGTGEQPRWIASQNRWRARYVDANGKRRSVYSSTPGRAGAREAAAKRDDAVRRASLGIVDDPRLTVADFLERWLTDVAATKLRPSSLERYRGIVRGQLVPGLGSVPLGSLTPQHIARAYADAGGATEGHHQPRPDPADGAPRPVGGLAPLRPRRPPQRPRPGGRLAAPRTQPGDGCRPAAAKPPGDAAAQPRRGPTLPGRGGGPSARGPLHPGGHDRDAPGRVAGPALARRRLGDPPGLRPPHPRPAPRPLVAGRAQDRQERAGDRADRRDPRHAALSPPATGRGGDDGRSAAERRRPDLRGRGRRAAVGPPRDWRPKARAARRSSSRARASSPSWAMAIPRNASAGGSSRRAIGLRAPSASPAARARAAAAIEESMPAA